MKINGHVLPDKINVLGTTYKIFYDEDIDTPKYENANGYVELWSKEIHVRRLLFEEPCSTHMNNLEELGYKVLRHEILHAFINESGLGESSDWAMNEEMIDWFAKQFPKLKHTFEKVQIV